VEEQPSRSPSLSGNESDPHARRRNGELRKGFASMAGPQDGHAKVGEHAVKGTATSRKPTTRGTPETILALPPAYQTAIASAEGKSASYFDPSRWLPDVFASKMMPGGDRD